MFMFSDSLSQLKWQHVTASNSNFSLHKYSPRDSISSIFLDFYFVDIAFVTHEMSIAHEGSCTSGNIAENMSDLLVNEFHVVG
jgi:hypothetical protein